MTINPLSYSDIGTGAVDKINRNLGALQSEADALAGQLAAEASARQGADQQQAGAVAQAQQAISSAVQTLQGEISAETQTRSQAIATLGQQVAGEAQARSGGDAAEAQARTAADNELAGELAAERLTRAQADTSEATARAQGDQHSIDAVAAEAAARGAAISAEAQARAVVADDLVALGSRLDAADAKEGAARQAVSDALFQEAQAREALASQVDDVAASFSAATQAVVNDLASEVQTRAALGIGLSKEIQVRASADVALGKRLDGQSAALDALGHRIADVRVLATLSGRPGDSPDLFCSDLGVPATGLPPGSGVVVTPQGRVVRIPGAAILAAVSSFVVEPNRLYKFRAVVRRQNDTLDPAGDGVMVAVAWYDAAGRWLSGADTPIAILPLAIAMGRRQFTALIAVAPSDPNTIAVPAGAVYGRPFAQTYGDTAVTDVEVLTVDDVTDAGTVSIDVDDIADRQSRLEARQDVVPATVASRSFYYSLIFG